MKNKKTYPIAVPNISGNERKYLNDCIDSEFVSSVGPFVDQFEDKLQKCSFFKYASAVSSGTSALSLAQHVLGVKYNDLVIIPDYTFIATANSVKQNQADTWLIDIEKDNLNIDMQLVIDEISRYCKFFKGKWIHKISKQELKCVIPVMALGNFISSSDIDNFNEKIGLPLIIDAAGALGTSNDKHKLGELDILAATISFNGNKTFTCGGGGAILTNHKRFHDKVKHLSTTARSGYEYIHDEPAFNYRMTNVQAAIGCAQLDRFDEFLNKKRYIYEFYKKNINFNEVYFLDEGKSSHWLSYFIATDLSKERIKELYEYSNSQGILLRPFWVPMHKQPPYKASIKSSLENSKALFQKVVTLPSSTSLEDTDLKKIVNIINSFFNQYCG